MKFPLVFIFLLLLSSCYNKERECKDFRTGTFEFKYTTDGVEKIGRFVRTEDLNIDYYENKIDTASIRWINDCEFIMKHINPKNMSEEKAIHMKILTTSEDSYTFEYSLAIQPGNQKKHVEQGTATKIK
jgi:hypothetical protein